MGALVAFVPCAALLLAGARVFGAAARRLGQPAVVGEIVAGILAGQLVVPILPSGVAPLLRAVAMVGLALFMLVVGHDLDPALLRGRRRTVLGVAAGSVLVPLVAGTVTALVLTRQYAPRSHLGFVLFMAIAMSVTALPVLARIVADRGLDREALGAVSLAAAAVGDVVAWLGLAAVSAFSGAGARWQVFLLPIYLLVLVTAVRRLLRRLLGSPGGREAPPAVLVPVLAAGLFLSCATTEWLGLHYIFGALAFGAAMPRARENGPGAWVTRRADQAATRLVPLYFVVAGSQVKLAGLGGVDLPTLGIIIGVAVASKALGGYAGGRLAGLPAGVARPLAVLMNVRGLTEIAMLSVGLDLHLIDARIYSMMVVMAVVTTAMAGPVLRALRVGAGAPRASAARVADRNSRDAPRGGAVARTP